MGRSTKQWSKRKDKNTDVRLEFFRYALVAFASVIVLKLFLVQIIDNNFYQALASGQHEIFRELFPERGTVFVHDLKDESLVPVATNQQLAHVYADPRKVEDPEEVANSLAKVFGYDEEKVEKLIKRLDQPNDPYEPIATEVSRETLDRLLAMDLKGVFHFMEESRLYPEPSMSGHLLGFVGSDSEGVESGKYGIEGYFDEILAGKPGFIRSEKDIAGRLIAVADRSIEPAQDGADIVLTLDRTLQYKACTTLDKAVQKHGADSGSIIVVEPSTGRVLAMCGAPDFNSREFGKVESINSFNNPATFAAYEPGSIFKPFTMAGALDAGAVTPDTSFEDTGSVMVDGWPKPLGNAEGKVYGWSDMTKVLEDSINTGMIFAMRQMGQDNFIDYVKRFGFGEKTGIELDKELAGNIISLEKESEIYSATATFGQGITTTPIQIAMAYAAIANGGILKKPQIIDEIRYDDGTVEIRAPQDVRQVISSKTARTLGAMLVSVIEHGHGKHAAVPGYYIAGKTGTAQVANSGGYSNDYTIGSFAGFGPVEEPKFAMVVRIDNPKGVIWAESTAAPLFGEMAEFLLQYYEVPPIRSVE